MLPRVKKPQLKPTGRRRLHSLISAVFSRLVVTSLLLIAQLVWMVVLFYGLVSYADWVQGVFRAFSVLMCLALIRQDSTVPEYKISWIILFAIMPIQGGLLYLLWGDRRPGRHLRKRLERADTALAPYRAQDALAQQAAQQELQAAAPRAAQTGRYLRDYGPFPVYGGTAATYYPSGEAMFADLLAALENAKHSIYMESFIIGMGQMWGDVHEILRRKAAEGLDVRLIYDDAGCVSLLPHNYDDVLAKEGIRAYPFNRFVPLVNLVMNNRDHRKITVIDGAVAFTGGVNLADEYINRIERYGYWKDSAVRLEGPGARSFALMFLSFWQAGFPNDAIDPAKHLPPVAPNPAGGPVQPFCDSPVDDETVAKFTYLDLINQAQKTLQICTPYLILENDLITALGLAAKRGVDVRIYVPGIPDKKLIYQLTCSYFPALLREKVKIFTYTPGFLHAKTWLVDGKIAAVGSVNLDYRSLYLHFECGVLLYGGPALQDIAADLAEIEAASHAVQLKECHTGFFGTLQAAVMRLFAPLC